MVINAIAASAVRIPSFWMRLMRSFKKLFIHFPEDPPIAALTRAQMAEFFAWLQQEYTTDPDGLAPRGSMSLVTDHPIMYQMHSPIMCQAYSPTMRQRSSAKMR